MSAIFVSYRRGDSEGQARALYIQLADLIGKDSVFMDVDSISLGRDFRQILHERLGSCDLMLALIGPSWMDAKDAAGNRRLENPTDLVRQEIAAALKRNIPVIPVLLQGVQMPTPERLPEDLKDLAYRNGFELGHSTWESDVKEMIKRLGLVERKARASAQTTTRVQAQSGLSPALATLKRFRLVAVVAALTIVAGVAGLLFYLNGQKQREVGKPTEHPLAEGATSSPSPQYSEIAKPTNSEPASSSSGDSVALTGLDFHWPGDDCWDIFRGEQFVDYTCGSKKKALQAGSYTIKGKYAPVFTPFNVTIKSGSATRIELGGIFDFNWPGDDCWDIFRGKQFVDYACGTRKKAVQAGSYTIKGKYAPVFTPFDVTIKSGSITRIDLGGIFEFNWPGDDCWDIFRGEQFVDYTCGAKKKALQAGSYTIKGKYAPVFTPFNIKVANGAQVKAP
jgi:TIR domain